MSQNEFRNRFSIDRTRGLFCVRVHPFLAFSYPLSFLTLISKFISKVQYQNWLWKSLGSSGTSFVFFIPLGFEPFCLDHVSELLDDSRFFVDPLLFRVHRQCAFFFGRVNLNFIFVKNVQDSWKIWFSLLIMN